MASVLTHYTLTAGTANLIQNLPPNVVSILARAPSGNSGIVYFSIDETPSNATYSTPLRAGDSVVIDISPAIQEASRMGALTQEKFMRMVSYMASAANQTLNIEVVTWV